MISYCCSDSFQAQDIILTSSWRIQSIHKKILIIGLLLK